MQVGGDIEPPELWADGDSFILAGFWNDQSSAEGLWPSFDVIDFDVLLLASHTEAFSVPFTNLPCGPVRGEGRKGTAREQCEGFHDFLSSGICIVVQMLR